MAFFKQLITSPLSMSVIGWVMFPIAFMVMTLALNLGVTLEVAFWVLSPLLLIGLAAWILAFLMGSFCLVMGPDRKDGFLAQLFSLAPLGFVYLGQLYFDAGIAF